LEIELPERLIFPCLAGPFLHAFQQTKKNSKKAKIRLVAGARPFIRTTRALVGEVSLLGPIRKALTAFEGHLARASCAAGSHCSQSVIALKARLESMNGLFQATGAGARRYRNGGFFITMIYLIGAPITAMLEKQIPH
jgi:hypothetical protein